MKAQLHRPSVRALTVTPAKELPVSQAPTREPGASHSTFGRSLVGTCGPFANSSMNLCARILKVKRDSDSSSGCETTGLRSFPHWALLFQTPGSSCTVRSPSQPTLGSLQIQFCGKTGPGSTAQLKARGPEREGDQAVVTQRVYR